MKNVALLGLVAALSHGTSFMNGAYALPGLAAPPPNSKKDKAAARQRAAKKRRKAKGRKK